jgi:uncharacterized protein (TIGR00369 family)
VSASGIKPEGGAGARHRQPSSRHCFVCGVQNPIGMKIQFTDDGESAVRAEVVVPEHYNGYPGVVHGGIVAAILDEVSGRALLARGHDLKNLFVTLKMEIRYRAPTPTDTPLTAIGHIVQHGASRAKVHGEIRLPDGTVTAEADCVVARPPAEFAERWEPERSYWKVYD